MAQLYDWCETYTQRQIPITNVDEMKYQHLAVVIQFISWQVCKRFESDYKTIQSVN